MDPTLKPANGFQVAQWLLANNFLLSALELLVEAQEAGKESEVERLSEFFADHAKFPPEEVAKFGARDAMEPSKQMVDQAARLAGAEYDLRIAREDVQRLQEQLAGSLSPRVSSPQIHAAAGADPGAIQVGQPGKASHREQRQLNALIRQYLTAHGLKSTAMTLAEEAAGQLPSQDSLSSDLPTLVELWQGRSEVGAARTAAEEALASKVDVQRQLAEFEADASTLQAQLQAQGTDLQKAQGEAALLRKQLDWANNQLADAEDKARSATAAAQRTALVASSQAAAAGPASHKPLAAVAHAFNAVSVSEALATVSEAVPQIIPHVLIAKRDGLLPVLEALIEAHSDASVRDTLAQSLFNLVKRPNEAQRAWITGSLAGLGHRIGPGRTAAELLPHILDQVSHGFVERRILVAEAVGHLAHVVDPDIANSLLLSVVQQLAEDAEPGVRAAAAASLGLLAPALTGHDKYLLAEGMLLELAQDNADEVQQAAVTQLLPAILTWCQGDTLLTTCLLPGILAEAQKLLDQCPHLQEGPAGPKSDLRTGSTKGGLRVVKGPQQLTVHALLQLWQAAFPAWRSTALDRRPEWAPLPSATEASDEPPDDRPSRLSALASLASDQEASEPPEPSAASTTGSANGQPPSLASRASRQHSLPEASPPTDPLSSPTPSPGLHRTQASASHASLESLSLEDPPDPTSVPNGPSTAAPLTPANSTPSASPAPNPSAQRSPSQGLPAPEGLLRSGSRSRSQSLPQGASRGATPWQAAQAFAAWLTAHNGEHEEWHELSWLLLSGVPALLQLVSCVAPSTSTDTLRRQLAAVLAQICTCLGPDTAAGAVEPLLVAAGCLPHRPEASFPPAHIANRALDLIPQAEDAQASGRLCILPLLLQAVLPHCGQAAVLDMLRTLCRDSPQGPAWAVDYPQVSSASKSQWVQELVTGTRFAAAQKGFLHQVVPLITDLAQEASTSSRTSAATLAGAVTPFLPPVEAGKQVVPVLLAMSGVGNAAQVRGMALDALGEVWRSAAADQKLSGQLSSHFEALLDTKDHEVQMAVLRALSARTEACSAGQLQWLLQRVLHLLASMRQRGAAGLSPAQLQEASLAAWDAVRAVDSCQVEDKGVGLHLTAALQALRRESQLLGPTNVEVIDLMLRERSGSSPAKSPARPALSSRSSEDGAGLNLGSRKSESGELSVSGDVVKPGRRSLFGFAKDPGSSAASAASQQPISWQEKLRPASLFRSQSSMNKSGSQTEAS